MREYFAKKVGWRFEIWARVGDAEIRALHGVKFWRVHTAVLTAQSMQSAFDNGWWAHRCDAAK